MAQCEAVHVMHLKIADTASGPFLAGFWDTQRADCSELTVQGQSQCQGQIQRWELARKVGWKLPRRYLPGAGP